MVAILFAGEGKIRVGIQVCFIYAEEGFFSMKWAAFLHEPTLPPCATIDKMKTACEKHWKRVAALLAE